MGSGVSNKMDIGKRDYMEDVGCAISPKCTDCWLSICVDDIPRGIQKVQTRMRIYPYITKGMTAASLRINAGMNNNDAVKLLKIYKTVDGDYQKFIAWGME